jgi:DNA-binding NarL/FixJ family response regulator
MDKIRVIIIDDQAFFRSGLRQALSEQSELEVLECNPADDSVSLVESTMTDVALTATDLISQNGLELTRKITQRYPNTRVIAISPMPNDSELFEVIKTGAAAYLSKNTASGDLTEMIKRTYRGEYPINDSLITRPEVAKSVLKQFANTAIMIKNLETVAAPLTRRETQILTYIADGNSNKQIAGILEISEQTIKNHISSILRKLNANDRAHAVVLAIRHGWISINEPPS